MVIVPFKPEHYHRMKLQPAQASAVSFVNDEYLIALSQGGPCITAMDGETILGSCGVAKVMNHSGVLWGFISTHAGRHMIAMDKVARRFLSAVNMTRVEATVEKGFTPGCRWLELLGFEYEGLMRKYGPDGSDHIRYARVSWPVT